MPLEAGDVDAEHLAHCGEDHGGGDEVGLEAVENAEIHEKSPEVVLNEPGQQFYSLTPDGVANVEFGGPRRNRLFICATQSLYAVYLAVNGAGRP